MKILIFGGSGVISEYLTRLASENSIDVYCYCRGNKKEVLPKNIKVIIGDCFSSEELLLKLSEYEFDIVVDFLSFEKSQLYIKLNALKRKVKQYVFISSAVVYSLTYDNFRKNEEMEKNNNLWDYSTGKIDCEKLLAEFCAANEIYYTIVRPYITYGNQRVPFQINSFENSFSIINRIILGKQVIIAGDGNNRCTLTHSEDLCRVLIGLFLNPKAYNNDFHITSDESYTWNEVLDIIGETIGVKPKPIYIPIEFIERNSLLLKGSLVGDKARNMLFDNTKIKNAINNKQLFNVSLKEGLKKTYQYMKATPRFYRSDIFWDKEMDYLLERYYMNNCVNELAYDTAVSMLDYNLKLYRSNYIPLEREFRELEKNYNLLYRLSSLDSCLNKVESYFESMNIKQIAIYGIGNFGEKFYKIIKDSSKIQVNYIIDINVKEFPCLKICNLNDQLNKVDAIIITPIRYFSEIKQELLKKCDYKIISLGEVLDV